MKKLHILILTSSFPRYEGDYFGPWILEYAREYVRQGYKVTLVAPCPSDTDLKILSEENLNIERFHYFFPRKWQLLVHPPGMIPQIKKNPLLFFQIPFLLWFYFKKVNQIIKSNKIDIIHSQWVIPSGYIGSLISKKFRIPHFITSQGAEFYLSPHHPFSYFTKYTLKYCDALLPVSQQMASRAMKYGIDPERINIIPNAVNTNLFRPNVENHIRKELGIPDEALLILSIRRLVPEKRVEDILFALAKIKSTYPVHFIIIGDGPEKSNLENICIELKLINVVHFLGFLNNSDLPPYYSASDIYILSSEQEGLSLTLLEAMSSECIVIATNDTGSDDIIQHGENGFLYSLTDKKALIIQIEEILQSDKTQVKELRSKARRTIISNFSVEVVTEKLIKLFSNHHL